MKVAGLLLGVFAAAVLMGHFLGWLVTRSAIRSQKKRWAKLFPPATEAEVNERLSLPLAARPLRAQAPREH
jgi:hypothetical protein